MAETQQHTYQILTKRSDRVRSLAPELSWNENIWMGVSVEDKRVIHRLDDLKYVPASVRFLSLEPLIGPLDNLDLEGIDWVIVGGESGPESATDEKRMGQRIAPRTMRCCGYGIFLQTMGRSPQARAQAANFTVGLMTICHL